jgi:hypothetical protein
MLSNVLMNSTKNTANILLPLKASNNSVEYRALFTGALYQKRVD